MRILYVMDPIGSVNIKKDTTFAFMLESQARGHENWYCTLDGLSAEAGRAWVRAAPATVRRELGNHATLGTWERRSMDDFAIVFMRKDPPVDMAFLAATWILDLADPAHTLVVNRPTGLRAANEKAFLLNFGSVSPRSAVTRDAEYIADFVQRHDGRAVLKPLDRMGGSGIFLLRADDANFHSIVEQSTQNGREFVTVQAFVPEAAKGDKRILLMDGEPLGAILRVPKQGEFRGNLAAGGTAVQAEITDRDREIIAAVAPRLRAEGLWFVGLDVLGDYLTEVNVTSPTGVQEVDRFDGVNCSARVMEWVERNAPR